MIFCSRACREVQEVSRNQTGQNLRPGGNRIVCHICNILTPFHIQSQVSYIESQCPRLHVGCCHHATHAYSNRSSSHVLSPRLSTTFSDLFISIARKLPLRYSRSSPRTPPQHQHYSKAYRLHATELAGTREQSATTTSDSQPLAFGGSCFIHFCPPRTIKQTPQLTQSCIG